MGDFSNINKHFLSANHPISKKWYELYQKVNIQTPEIISTEQLNLVKYFLSSNAAMSQINNPYFRKILDPKIKVHSWRTFRLVLAVESKF
jgi:hypothetical protein